MESKQVRGLRLQLELSQERFAQLLGVSLQTVRRWEEGLTKPLPIINLKLEELQQKTEQQKGDNMARRRQALEFGFGSLFKGIGSVFDLVSRMAEEGKEQYASSGEIKGADGKVKGVYGFSIKVGTGGKPVIEQFGNIKTTERGAVVAEVREPIVDVFDEADSLTLLAEIPGVEASDIHLELKDDILELSAEAEDRKYHKEVLLPCRVEASSMKSTYKNGILELKLRKS